MLIRLAAFGFDGVGGKGGASCNTSSMITGGWMVSVSADYGADSIMLTSAGKGPATWESLGLPSRKVSLFASFRTIEDLGVFVCVIRIVVVPIPLPRGKVQLAICHIRRGGIIHAADPPGIALPQAWCELIYDADGLVSRGIRLEVSEPLLPNYGLFLLLVFHLAPGVVVVCKGIDISDKHERATDGSLQDSLHWVKEHCMLLLLQLKHIRRSPGAPSFNEHLIRFRRQSRQPRRIMSAKMKRAQNASSDMLPTTMCD